MEVKLFGGEERPFMDAESWDSLLSVLNQDQPVVATVKRITSQSVLLKIGTRNWELPLNKLEAEQGKQLSAGDQVQLKLLSSERLLINKTGYHPIYENPKETPLIPSSIQEAVLELGVPANPTTEAVAEALLKGGFALKEQLIWALVPWAEQGLLESAILLLQAKFPLTLELVEAVERFKERGPQQALLENVKENLSPELQETLEKPTWENRGKISTKAQDLKVLQGLTELVVEENFVQSLFNRNNLETEYVFSLPFLLGSDLHTSWVRIKPEQENQENAKQEPKFRIDLLIPTLSCGLVETELVVWGKSLRLTLWMENADFELMEDQLSLLKQELIGQGWTPSSLSILEGPREGGFAHAKSGCFTI